MCMAAFLEHGVICLSADFGKNMVEFRRNQGKAEKEAYHYGITHMRDIQEAYTE